MIKKLATLSAVIFGSMITMQESARADMYMSANMGYSQITSPDLVNNSSQSFRITLGYDWQIVNTPLSITAQAGYTNWSKVVLDSAVSRERFGSPGEGYTVDPTIDLMVGLKYTIENKLTFFLRNGILRGEVQETDKQHLEYAVELGASYRMSKLASIQMFYLRSMGGKTNFGETPQNNNSTFDTSRLPTLEMYGLGVIAHL